MRSCKMYFSLWISMASSFKKDWSKIRIINWNVLEELDTDMLLIIEKGIRGGICHVIHSMQKLIANIWKIMIKIKNHHILIIGM